MPSSTQVARRCPPSTATSYAAAGPRREHRACPCRSRTRFVVDGALKNGDMTGAGRTYVTRYRFTRFVGTYVAFSALVFVVGAVVFPWNVANVRLVPVPTRSEWVLLA